MTESAPSPILDTSVSWVKKQIEEYLATGGEQPKFRYGSPLLLLTTRGVSTGQWRRNVLIFGRDGDDVLIVASKGGDPKAPKWYCNIEANPRVWLQIKTEEFWATAHTATPDEKPRLWKLMADIYPPYDEYQEKTTRDIPIVVLTPER